MSGRVIQNSGPFVMESSTCGTVASIRLLNQNVELLLMTSMHSTSVECVAAPPPEVSRLAGNSKARRWRVFRWGGGRHQVLRIVAIDRPVLMPRFPGGAEFI